MPRTDARSTSARRPKARSRSTVHQSDHRQVDPTLRGAYLEAAGQQVLSSGESWGAIAYATVHGFRGRKRRLAEVTLRWAMRDLGIARPRMRFFVPAWLAPKHHARAVAFCLESRLRGLADPVTSEIWIRADLPNRELVEVVAHEARHFAQYSRDDANTSTRNEDEAEAQRYGRRAGRGDVARRVGGRIAERWKRARLVSRARGRRG